MLKELTGLALRIVLALLPEIIEQVHKSRTLSEAEARARAVIQRKGIETAFTQIRDQL